MRSFRFVAPCFVCALSLLVGVTSFTPAAVSQEVTVTTETPDWMDERIPSDEQSVLLSTVGYQMPEFDSNVQWLGKEQPTFASLRGDVVVLHTWNSATTDGRAMTRRVNALLRPLGDEVHQIALHTPEDSEKVIAKYARHTGNLPAATAIDPEGAYLDELGLWKTPRLIVIGRDGAIRHAGVSLASLRDVVRETLESEDTDPVEALPSRADRMGETVQVEEATDFPPHNRIQAGDANNLQGQDAPELVVQKYVRGGKPETEGKVVMIEFWATWCGPCIRGIPHLNDLQNEFAEDLVIVGISDETETKVVGKMRTDPRLSFEYTVAVDPQRRVQARVGNRGIPHCIVVSSDGVVRWQGHPSRVTSAVMGAIIEANKGGGATKRWVQGV